MISFNKPCCVHKAETESVAETILQLVDKTSEKRKESSKFLSAYSIRVIEIKWCIEYTEQAAVCCKIFDHEILKTWDLRANNF